MLEIKDYKVYGLENAVLASGLPMSIDTSSIKFSGKRMSTLGKAKAGSGHNCACKGILVTARVKYPLYWTKQFQRYHFADIISSQSTMHRITVMNIKEQCNEWVDDEVIARVEYHVKKYNEGDNSKDRFMRIISNVPSGLEMEMEITTNYLQLKTIYDQRKSHKLPDWTVFCDWILSLPKFKEYMIKEVK